MRTLGETHAARLTALADFLWDLPEDRFDLRLWRGRGDVISNPCSTVACACGWGAAVPILRRAGYSVSKYGTPFLRDGLWGWSAVEEVFGLEKRDARHLFLVNSYRSGRRGPRNVARRIRQFVRDRSAAR